MGRICTECNNITTRHFKNNEIYMICKCGLEKKGDEEDILINNIKYHSGVDENKILLERLQHDGIIQKVNYDCKCGLKYVNRVVLDKVYFICKRCGVVNNIIE